MSDTIVTIDNNPVVIDTRYAFNDCDNYPLKNVIDVIVNVMVLTTEIDHDNPMHDSFTHFKHKEVVCNINVYNDATKDGNEDASEDLNEHGFVININNNDSDDVYDDIADGIYDVRKFTKKGK